jgi:hypothetical protein
VALGQPSSDEDMKKGLARIVGWARKARDAWPLTWLGVLVAAGAAAALFHYGLGQIDLLLLIVGIIGLALVALAFLFVSVTALVLFLRVRKRKSDKALELDCGNATRTDFTLLRPWFVPFVRIGWTWVEPEARVVPKKQGFRVAEEVTPVRRAIRDDIVRKIEVSDWFGLARVRFTARELRQVRFVPSMGALKNIHCVRAMAGGEDISHPDGPPEGERADLRRYNPGDPIRFILWKVFARTRELMVRTPERAIAMVDRTVAYLVTGEGDEPAAGAARVAAQSGALGGKWILGVDGTDEQARDRERATELLCKSSLNRADQGGTGLGEFLRTAAPGGLTRAVVFVPAKPGPWLDHVLASARSAGRAGVEFVVCCDGVERPPGGGLFRRFAYQPAASASSGASTGPVKAADLSKVIQKLAGGRGKVIVIDRLAGRVYNESLWKSLEVAA